MNNNNNNGIRLTEIKVFFIGETKVGKTSLIRNYLGETFKDDVLQTLGYEEFKKKIQDEEHEYNINIWDMPYMERTLTSLGLRKLFRSTNVIILVFDMTSKKSFLFLDTLLKVFFDVRADKDKVMFLLIGNKADLHDKWEIKESDAKKFADIIHAKFILTSAKYGPALLQDFLETAFKEYLRKFNEEIDNQNQRINLNHRNRREIRPCHN